MIILRAVQDEKLNWHQKEKFRARPAIELVARSLRDEIFYSAWLIKAPLNWEVEC